MTKKIRIETRVIYENRFHELRFNGTQKSKSYITCEISYKWKINSIKYCVLKGGRACANIPIMMIVFFFALSVRTYIFGFRLMRVIIIG